MTSNQINSYQEDLEHYLQSSHAKAMILISEEDVLEVANGKISQKSFRKLEITLRRNYPGGNPPKNNQYLGLSLGGRHHLVAVKHLTDQNCVVGLVFPLRTPLAQVREATKEIIRKLQGVPVKTGGLVQTMQYKPQNQQGTPNGKRSTPSDSGWRKEISDAVVAPKDQSLTDHVKINSQVIRNHDKAFKGAYITYGAARQNRQHLPGHNPVDTVFEPSVDEITWQQIEGDVLILEEPGGLPLKTDNPQHSIVSASNQPINQKEDLASILQSDFELQSKPGLIETWKLPSSDFEDHLDPQPTLEPGGKPSENTEKIKENAFIENVMDITFHLVPKDGLYLRGEIAYHLRRWLPALCLSYGWQLNSLTVRPNCLGWTLVDFPESLIQKMLKIVRLSTSEQLLESFPDLKTKILDGDFWIPGYLVDTNNQCFSAMVKQDRFIGHQQQF
jgi:hypothetical protein